MAQPGERYYLSETIVDNIRHRMGWCPHGVPRKTRSLTGPEPFLPVQASVPFGPAAPDPSVTVPAENRLEYQTNLLLVLVFLAGLFYATTPDLIVPFCLLNAVLVYFIAENIHAGRKYEEVSLHGEVATWRQIVRAAAVFIGTIVLFAVYLFCRQEFNEANI